MRDCVRHKGAAMVAAGPEHVNGAMESEDQEAAMQVSEVAVWIEC